MKYTLFDECISSPKSCGFHDKIKMNLTRYSWYALHTFSKLLLWSRTQMAHYGFRKGKAETIPVTPFIPSYVFMTYCLIN
jgi:hypothetical protein